MSLRKLFSLLGSIAGLSSVGACSPESFKVEPIVRTNPFPLPPGEPERLCGAERLAKARELEKRNAYRRSEKSMVAFGDPLKFKYVGDTIDATAYVTYTFLDGEAFGGKYAMRATFSKGYTGGPAGSATEYSVDVDDVHLVERLVRPKTPPGVRGIMPGEFVLRAIDDGDVAKVHDKYMVHLDAGKKAQISFEPYPDLYKFQLRVSKDGVEMPTRHFDGPTIGQTGYLLNTTTAGLYLIEVGNGPPASRVPDHYHFFIVQGEVNAAGGACYGDWIKWKDVVLDDTTSSRVPKKAN